MHLSVPVSHWDRFSFLIRRKSLLTSQHMCPPDICGSVIPTGETGDAAALQEFTNIATNSFFWIFNIYVADVTTVDLVVTDSTGASAQSAPITVQSG
ncbi:hypothetical protein C2E23DRAFT_816835, partial [Lenzites betulinus]